MAEADNTDAALLSFLTSSTAVEHGLMRAISLLEGKLHPTGDEEREINFRAPQLRSALALVQQKELAAIRGLTEITAPTDANVEQAKSISIALDQMTSDDAAVNDVVAKSIELLQAWGNLTQSNLA